MSELTSEEQRYYNELDELVTSGALEVQAVLGSQNFTSDEEIVALLESVKAGRPNLGEERATGNGPSARRQVRLPEHTNKALDEYANTHNTTPSEVMRQALEQFLVGA